MVLRVIGGIGGWMGRWTRHLNIQFKEPNGSVTVPESVRRNERNKIQFVFSFFLSFFQLIVSTIYNEWP